jgi:hypothetical protein
VATLSLRRLWTIYKRLAAQQGLAISTRDVILEQAAFCAGARGVLKVLAHTLEAGDLEELHATIKRQGRLLRKIQGRRRTPQRRH